MTNKKSTKRALLLSVMALLLSFSMLLGTTLAWFTDSVTSGNNIIKPGNLDITLEYWDGSGWADVEGATDILTNELWEPGVTEVAYLRVANAGSLALKYQLGINILNELAGKNQKGETFLLSDYLLFGVVEGVNGESAPYSTDDAGRAAAIAAVTDAKKISAGYTKAATMQAGESALYFALVVYMPTDTDDKANHNGTDIPQINLGINVVATQMTAENDDFNNQYDANAPFSIWDGTVPAEMPASLVVDGNTQTIHVKDAAAFAYLSTLSAKWAEFYTDGNGETFTNYANGAGADYYYSSRWTVSLEADIDLGNHLIAPVVLVIGESTGASAFKGNYHTIRNINTTTGLFADNNRVTYADLALENVSATNGALTGSSNTSITNVTVKNAAISGADYVGGLVGYIYGNVIGCEVIDSAVVGVKEAGGLIGYIASSSGNGVVTSNEVQNVSVYANNRAAGLVAQANTGVKVYGNTVDTVTVGVEDATNYQPGAVISNAIVPENVYDNTVVNATVETSVVIADNATELTAALAADGTVVLANDLVVSQKMTVATGADLVLDLAGHEIAAAFNNNGGSALIDNKGDLTVKNGKIVSLAEYPDVDWGEEGFPTYATNTISNHGTLIVGEGTVIENQTAVGGASYAVDNYAGATLIVEDGATILAKDVAIRMFSGNANAENKVVVNGGVITGKRAIWVQLPSSNSAVAPKTTVEITGGELTGTSGLAFYSYSYGNSFAQTSVTISGGTFNGDVQFGGGYKGDTETVTVTGGTFNGYLGRWLVNDGWEDISKP